MGIGRGFVDLAKPTGGKHHGFCVEDVNIAGGQFVGDDAGSFLWLLATFLGPARRVGNHQQVQHIELVEEVDAELDAVLIERLQNHVTGAVGGVTRATDRGFSVVTGVSTKATLVDLAIGGSVKRKPHVF